MSVPTTAKLTRNKDDLNYDEITDKRIIYSPKLAKALGGVSTAVLLNYLLHISEGKDNPYKLSLTRDEIEFATGLNALEREAAIQKLKAQGLIAYQVSSYSTLEFSFSLPTLERFLKTIDNRDKPADSLTVTQTKVDPHFEAVRRPISVAVSPNYRFDGPWESQQQFEAFQRELLEYFKQKGVPNPALWAFKVIDSITKGIISPLWDDFVNGVPLETSQQVQRPWEISPGQPYPAFEEERTQYYVHRGEPLDSALAKARRDLRNPEFAKDLWEGFLRKYDRVADDALKAQKLGVQTPYLPPAFQEQTPATKEAVMDKLTQLASPSLPPQETATADTPSVPSLSTLQSAYAKPMGKNLIKKLINQHPEWGYGIEDGEIVDLYPF